MSFVFLVVLLTESDLLHTFVRLSQGKRILCSKEWEGEGFLGKNPKDNGAFDKYIRDAGGV